MRLSTGNLLTRNAEPTKVNASTTKATGPLSSWTSNPPTLNPAASERADPPDRVAFASSMYSRPTTDGRIDRSAIREQSLARLVTKATRKSNSRLSRSSHQAIGIEKSATARVRSVTIRTRLRDQRSTHIPANEPRIAVGTTLQRLSNAIWVGPASSSLMAMNGNAVAVISDPKIEIIDADIRSRNERNCQTPRSNRDNI